MTNRIRELRKQKGITMKQLGRTLGLAESTISQYETGKRQPDNETLIKLSDYFGVTVGYLLGAEHERTPILTKKDERDIANTMELLMAQLSDGDTLMFDGDPMTEEARESILSAMRLGLEAAKIRNKERFTPKKYRKG